MERKELLKMGAEMIDGILYLNRVEVGRMQDDNCLLTEAGREALRAARNTKLSARKQDAEDVVVREKPRRAAKAKPDEVQVSDGDISSNPVDDDTEDLLKGMPDLVQ